MDDEFGASVPSGPSKLAPVTDAFKAIDERNVNSRTLADASKLVGELYSILFAASTKLSGILQADLDAHISELVDYNNQNCHGIPPEKIREELLPLLATGESRLRLSWKIRPTN